VIVLVGLGCAALAVVTGLTVYVYFGAYWDEYKRGDDVEH